MLQGCYSKLDTIIEKHVCLEKKANDEAANCRSMILGSLLSQLMAHRLYPNRLSGSDINLSVRGLQGILESIKLKTIDSVDYTLITKHVKEPYFGNYPTKREDFIAHGVNSHAKCGNVVNNTLHIVLTVGQMASPTLISHKRHMEMQASK